MIALADVKKALNITGEFQDYAIQAWIDETVAFLVDAGVKENNITVGIVAKGVTDLWNYGSGDGMFSAYFKERAIQLSLK